MSDLVPATRYHAVTWEVYPRVFYFRARLLDVYKRFIRITDALPKVLRDETLLEHISILQENFRNKTPHIVVIGTDGLAPEDVFVSSEAYKPLKESDSSNKATVFICLVSVSDWDRSGMKDTLRILHHFCKEKLTEAGQLDSVILMCKTNTHLSAKEKGRFREQIWKEAPNSMLRLLDSRNNMLISTNTNSLKFHISAHFETHIAQALLKMRSCLSPFEYNTSVFDTCIPGLDVLKDRTLTRAIESLLQNGFRLSEFVDDMSTTVSFSDQIREKIALIVKCVIIGPMSSKYTLPKSFCSWLLHEIEFENALMSSVSEQTQKYIILLYPFASSCFQKLQNIQPNSIIHENTRKHFMSISQAPGIILKHLQKDFRGVASKAEMKMSVMETLRETMRKMVFEIDGYLKQTTVGYENFEIPALPIPVKLRRDILAVDGVFGMGTIYGKVEVHLKVENEDNKSHMSDLIKRVQSVVLANRFDRPCTIKFVK